MSTMASESPQAKRPSKRRIILSDSDSDSDDSLIIQPQFKKKKIYRVQSSSAENSSSDSDSDIPRPSTKRCRKILVSEDESSFDSDSSDQTYIAASETSADWESDWVSDSDEDKPSRKSNQALAKKADNAKQKDSVVPNSDSSDSDGSSEEGEKCPICLLKFKRQNVGIPNICEHVFCFDCISEWSKNINTCPVDRKMFTSISKKDHVNATDSVVIKVEEKTASAILEGELYFQEDQTFCEVCNQSNREDRMLLCDGCDLGYHLECLTPPMETVPMEEWFCPDCVYNQNRSNNEPVSSEFNEFSQIMNEARTLGNLYGRTRAGIPSENNLFAILPRRQHSILTTQIRRRTNNRTSQAREAAARSLDLPSPSPTTNETAERVFDPNQPSTSTGLSERTHNFTLSQVYDNVPSTSSASHRSSSSSTKRKRSTSSTSKVKRKNSRKSKGKSKRAKTGSKTLYREVTIRDINADGEEEETVTLVKVSVKSKKKRKKRTSRKRKTKSKRRAAAVKTPKTARDRIANNLGIVKSSSRELLPSVKVRSSSNEGGALSQARYSAGISKVSLFGNDLGLDYSPPGSDDETTARTVPVQTKSVKPNTSKATSSGPSTSSAGQSTIDLIGSIMNSQEIWHNSKKNKNKVILKYDGSLVIDNKEKTS